MNPKDFFTSPKHPIQRQYEALRAFFVEKLSVDEIALKFEYKKSSVYSLTRDFRTMLKDKQHSAENFFIQPQPGRKPNKNQEQIHQQIILLRKKYLSVPDIKSILDAQGESYSERYIYQLLKAEGFARLPRRNQTEKQTAVTQEIIEAPKSLLLTAASDSFNTNNAGMLIFLVLIKKYGIDKLIEFSSYPGTEQLPTLQSILAFMGLKLSNICRYSSDDLWCMDRGLGLLAGLNVLPKAAWYSSYSTRVTRQMNVDFLKAMHELWMKQDLLSDTVNMDFVTIPYWGEQEHLENNWSGTRHHALKSMLAAIGQDPDSGLITYGNASVRHEDESNVAVEFLDFYKKSGDTSLKYLVFDSKFTTYQNLRKLEDGQIHFITIRRRGKKIVESLENLPVQDWKKIRVPASKGKTRQIKVHDSKVTIKGYGPDKEIRQIAITGHGKIKPAIIITNDFDMKTSDVVRKYARRWLVEKTISEQTHFFHLNRLSSSIVIKVDFDLTMTILAYNLYRLLANELPGYESATAKTLFEKFIHNDGYVICDDQKITVQLKKKRKLPLILDMLNNCDAMEYPWLNDRKLYIEGATTT